MATVRVKLSDVLEAMELQFDECRMVLHKSTGTITAISDDDIRAAEEDTSTESVAAWDKGGVEAARDFLAHEDDYVVLPTQFDIDEYSIMERFCLSLPDGNISDRLYRAIKGRGAFRRFKDRIHQLGVADQWYRYRDEALRAIAVEWCEENDIEHYKE